MHVSYMHLYSRLPLLAMVVAGVAAEVAAVGVAAEVTVAGVAAAVLVKVAVAVGVAAEVAAIIPASLLRRFKAGTS